MKIKDILELESDLSKIENLPDLFTGDIGARYYQAKESLDSNSEQAKDIILAKMNEKDFVRAMNMIQHILVSSCTASGDHSLLSAEIAGTLMPYTHTIVLTILGVLVEEEII